MPRALDDARRRPAGQRGRLVEHPDFLRLPASRIVELVSKVEVEPFVGAGIDSVIWSSRGTA